MDPIAVVDSPANWFLGLVVPPQRSWEALTADLPAGMRRFAPEDRHLTVAFLGPCGEERPQRPGGPWRRCATRRSRRQQTPGVPWGPADRPSAYGLTLAEGRDATPP